MTIAGAPPEYLPNGRVALWGGAASAALPENVKFLDCSSVRLVPDNQEVFMEIGDNDRSVIFEIVEFQEGLRGAAPKQVAEYFLRDLAQENGASDSEISCARLEETALAQWHENVRPSQIIIAFGLQKMPNGAVVRTFMGIYRLPELGAEILVTYYKSNDAGAPVQLNKFETEAEELFSSFVLHDASLLSA